jgi:hypothetical protein
MKRTPLQTITDYHRINRACALIIVSQPARYQGLALIWARMVLKNSPK